MPFFDSAGIKIHYQYVGSGEAVVLVHGFASTMEHNWGGTGWIAALSEKYRVIAPHVRPLVEKLWEMRLTGAAGIGRVIYTAILRFAKATDSRPVLKLRAA